MRHDKPHHIIVGGGITGLSAAWQLQKLNQPYTLIESSGRWGGKVQTETVDVPGGRLVIDAGPESFISRKPELWELAHELGLGHRVIDPGNETRRMFVLHGGKPVAVPLSPLRFAASPLLSPKGKLRLLAEPFIAPRTDDCDESLAAFVTRRLGREALDQLIGPILAGIYNTDPETQSILTTSPVMREMERDHGGLFRGAVARMVQRRRQRKAGHKLPPAFFSFANGAQEVIDAITAALTGQLRLNTAVTRIARRNGGFEVLLAGGESLAANSIIVATPANTAAGLLREAAPEAASQLGRIRHTHIGTISLAYAAAEARTSVPINGLMIPRREQRGIDAVTFTTAKLPGRAPQGYVLVRVFFGGGRPRTAELGDEDLLVVVRRELEDLIGLSARPVAHRAYRWLNAFPQAEVGHLSLVDQIEASLPTGLMLAGSSYRGVGVPDCVRQGREAAVRAAGLFN